MSQTTVVKVKVEEMSKYGFKSNGRYVNYSKQLSDADKAKVVPGAEFDAEYFVADSGREYLNKILSDLKKNPVGKVEVETKVNTARAKKFTPSFKKKDDAPTSAGLTKDEWAAKDRRISRQGCIQAAVQALGPSYGDESALFVASVKLADKMLEYANQ
jgi:hypothetical protein